MLAPLHPLEDQRLKRLRDLGLVGSPRNSSFDRLVFQAAQITRTPIAAICFLDDQTQWLKSFVGLLEFEITRTNAFCTYTILESDILVVPDTLVDRRFHDNPYVIGPPYVRFYAGVAIRSPDALPLGSLCIADRAPRTLSTEQSAALRQLAIAAEALLPQSD